MSNEAGVPLDEKSLGAFFSKYRDELGITTTELGKRAGVSQGQISRLENGKQGFRSATLRRIAEGLGLEARVVFVKREASEG